eukprot:4743195-Prymnesium_polylepis.1
MSPRVGADDGSSIPIAHSAARSSCGLRFHQSHGKRQSGYETIIQPHQQHPQKGHARPRSRLTAAARSPYAGSSRLPAAASA